VRRVRALGGLDQEHEHVCVCWAVFIFTYFPRLLHEMLSKLGT
jgi:hypothetical protein